MIKKPRYDVKRLFYYGLLCTIATLIVFIIIVLAGSARAGTIGVLWKDLPDRGARRPDGDREEGGGDRLGQIFRQKRNGKHGSRPINRKTCRDFPRRLWTRCASWTWPLRFPSTSPMPREISLTRPGTALTPFPMRISPISWSSSTGGKRNQVDWLKRLSFLKDPQVMVIISDGNFYDLIHELRMPVYYLDTQFASRFQLEAVPSIIVQKGVFMEVSEYAVK